MRQEDLNSMMRNPGEIKTAPAELYLPRCPECGERYLGDGVTLCVDCAARRAITRAAAQIGKSMP